MHTCRDITMLIYIIMRLNNKFYYKHLWGCRPRPLPRVTGLSVKAVLWFYFCARVRGEVKISFKVLNLFRSIERENAEPAVPPHFTAAPFHLTSQQRHLTPLHFTSQRIRRGESRFLSAGNDDYDAGRREVGHRERESFSGGITYEFFLEVTEL